MKKSCKYEACREMLWRNGWEIRKSVMFFSLIDSCHDLIIDCYLLEDFCMQHFWKRHTTFSVDLTQFVITRSKVGELVLLQCKFSFLNDLWILSSINHTARKNCIQDTTGSWMSSQLKDLSFRHSKVFSSEIYCNSLLLNIDPRRFKVAE